MTAACPPPEPMVNVSLQLNSVSQRSIEIDASMTFGPGPEMRPLTSTPRERLAEHADAQPAVNLDVVVERLELEQRIEADVAFRGDADVDAEIEPAADLERVRRDGDVRFETQPQAGQLIEIGGQRDAAHRRDDRGRRIEARIEAADRKHLVRRRAPAHDEHGVARGAENAERLRVDERGADRQQALDEIDLADRRRSRNAGAARRRRALRRRRGRRSRCARDRAAR